MNQTTRRTFLAATAAASVAAVTRNSLSQEDFAATETDDRPVPMLHMSDLFRPHNDPDDHWDLACVYALALQQRVDLLGVLIDFPQPGRGNDPDIQAVAQMNYLTGQSVPVMIGSPRSLLGAEARHPDSIDDVRGVRACLDLLQKSDTPVVINVLGSCRDVAIAGHLEPELFKQKCRAIYLNAGSGTPDPEKAGQLEWNVKLDPAGYAAVFHLPCPIYWMPCFEEVPAQGRAMQVERFGTFYRFHHSKVLPNLSEKMQRFFAYMYREGKNTERTTQVGGIQSGWLKYLDGPTEFDVIQYQLNQQRNMWCTAGFLHACGLTVTKSGEIVSQVADADPVFSFDPVQVRCSPASITEWTPAQGETNRYLFQVRDVAAYEDAMTRALSTLLSTFAD